MKTIRYYPFNRTGTFTGTQSAPVPGDEQTVVSGDMQQPGDCLKLAYGTNPWAQQAQSVAFLDGELIITTLTEEDWTDKLKSAWLIDYLRHCNTEEQVYGDFHYQLMFLAQDRRVYEQLSGVSLAYVNRDPDTDVVSIGVNSYPLPFVYQYATQGAAPVALQDSIRRQHTDTPVLVSHAFKVRYRDVERVVWAFGGITYDYALSESSYNLTTGGGNTYAQVQLGGKERRASYVIKSRIDPADPTMGLFSGVSDRLYTNEEIVLIDTSIWTQDTETDWTWVGDFTQLPLKWNIADVSDAGNDYWNLPVRYMQFPTSIIQDKNIDSFG